MTDAPVLHVCAWPGELAGAPRSMEESAAALLAAGRRALVWTATGSRLGGCPSVDRMRARGIEVRNRAAESALDPLAVADLVETLRGLGPGAVLHTHGERALLWGSVAAPLARARHVHTLHGFVSNTPGDRRRNAVAVRLLRRVDAVVAVHGATAAQVEGLPATVVPNCLDAELFARDARDAGFRARFALTPANRVYLYLGRLSQEKGADTLGVIQATLQAASAAARLVVAGGGEYSPGVEAMTDVTFLGRRDDPAAVLSLADVVLMPSRSEGLPMTALEAAALRKPVVGFAVGGLADSGLADTVPAGRVEDLARRAVHLVRNAEEAQEVVERATAALRERYHPERHAALLGAVYDRLG